MKCLIVGYGSIGKKHSHVLHDLQCDVDLVTSQMTNDFSCYSSIQQAFENNSYDYVVIANETYLHFSALTTLIKLRFQGIVLVEKPLFSTKEILPENKFKKLLVAYNLRFSQLLTTAKKFLQGEELISFSANVGQYLPTWRKNTDYRASYSAKHAQGGGVLNDLSHELDYSLWFCGKSLAVTAIGGHYSNLEIDSDDIYSVLMQCESCPIVNIQINYLDRSTRRDILIHTKNHSIYIDLINGVLNIDGKEENRYPDDIKNTYKLQHQSALTGDYQFFCSYEEGINVVNLIEKITEANHMKTWVKL